MDSLSELVAKVQRLVEGQHGSVDGKPSISPAIRQTADGIVVQGKARLSEISRADEASKKIGQLVGEMRKLDRYAASLKMFADRFEMNPNAADFTLSAEEAGLWSGFKDWQLIASQIKQIPLEKIAPQDAERWFTRIKLANQTLQLVNWRESANALGVYLGKKKEVGSPAEPRLLNRITDTLSQPLFADIDVVPRNDGLFYLAGKTGTRFTHFLPDGKTGSEAFKQGESSSKAPHCQVVNALLDKLNSSSSVPADKLVFELLDIVLASEADESKSVDPLVTCELLNQILLFGKYVAPVIRGFSDAQRGKLREAGVVGIDWRVFDDKNGEVTIARRESPSAIAQFRTQFATIKDTSSAVEFSPELCLQWTEVADYEVVGFLYRTGQAWGIDSNRLLQDGEGLYCLIPQPDKVVAVSRVGDYASGTIANTPDTSLLQAGRIVYSRKTEQNK